MTNKGKVLAAVVAVAVVLAGGVGLYFKGGDLMGKMFGKTPGTVQKVVLCPSETETVYNYTSETGSSQGLKYKSFNELYDGIKAKLDANNGTCAYRFKLFVDAGQREDVITCGNAKGLYAGKAEDGSKYLDCYREFEDEMVAVRVLDAVDYGFIMEISYSHPQSNGSWAGSVIERVRADGFTVETVPWSFY
ncbi:MAG: hypothetical protein WC604_03170 [Candidatus Gracilibacteria bacterium]